MALLGGDDSGGAASEAAVINAGDGGVMMGEFRSELLRGYEIGFGFGVVDGGAGGGGVRGGHFGKWRWA